MFDWSEVNIDKLADDIMSLSVPDAIESLVGDSMFTQYQDNPVGFIEDALGETLTDDLKEMVESVRDHQVTVAVSSNGTGKSWVAARIAVWFYVCFPDTKVFTAAAPPYDNLKNILWGEIGSIVRDHPQLFADQDVTSMEIRRGPEDFLIGVTIPSAGSDQEKEAKFCTDADELFELTTGELVTYRSLIGKTVDIVSIDSTFNRSISEASFFDNGTEDVYEIVLSNGHKLLRTSNHPLYTGRLGQDFHTYGGTHVKGRYRVSGDGWTHAEDILPEMVMLCPDDTSFNFGTKTPDLNQIKVMAYLIGDGCISSQHQVSFFQEDNAQLADFRSAIAALGARTSEYDKKRYRVNVSGYNGKNPILNLLRKHNMQGHDSFDKQVPDIINQSSRESVSLFLNRLFSTDGWACMCKVGSKYRKAEIGYGSNSECLIRDIQRLLHRFGIFSTVRRKKTSWTHDGIKKHSTTWVCTICKSEDIIRFADQIGIYGKEAQVEECANYARTRKVYAAWKQSSHEGFIWSKVKSVKLIGPKSTVGVHVPGDNTYLTNVVEHNSGKHQRNMLFAFDEGDAIPEPVYKGTESCMSGGHVRLLIMFNPRHAAGSVYRMIRDKTANVVHLSALRHPNVITGEDKIPGAVSREVTVRRINEWTRPLRDGDKISEKSVYTLPDFLVDAIGYSQAGHPYPPLQAGQYKIINPSFSYMVLGRYPAQGSDQLISEEWVSNARSRYDAYVAQYGDVPPKGATGVMGLDVAAKGDDSNVAVGRYGGYLTNFDAWNGIDTVETGDRAIAWYKSHKGITRANIDANGVGTGVAPHMQRFGDNVVAVSVMVTTKPTIKCELGEFRILRDELLWRVREWLRCDSGAMLPPCEPLLEELVVPTYDTDSGRVEIMKTGDMKKLLGRSPDYLMSLAQTFAGAGSFFSACEFKAFPG